MARLVRKCKCIAFCCDCSERKCLLSHFIRWSFVRETKPKKKEFSGCPRHYTTTAHSNNFPDWPSADSLHFSTLLSIFLRLFSGDEESERSEFMGEKWQPTFDIKTKSISTNIIIQHLPFISFTSLSSLVQLIKVCEKIKRWELS